MAGDGRAMARVGSPKPRRTARGRSLADTGSTAMEEVVREWEFADGEVNRWRIR